MRKRFQHYLASTGVAAVLSAGTTAANAQSARETPADISQPNQNGLPRCSENTSAVSTQTAQNNPGDCVQSTASASAQANQIVVTGTSIAGVRPVGSATITVDSEKIRNDGLRVASDLTRVIPQLQASNVSETGGSTFNNSRGSTFNLRGIGSQGTLTLVDGRRIVPSGGRTTFNEANVVPLAAVDRVEIVTDGNSAIYGADAVAGVVNFILKKNYRGAEVSAVYDRQLGGNRGEIGFVGGTTWNLGGLHGNVIGTVTYSEREPVYNTSSPFLSRNLVPLGGNNAAINGATFLSNAPGTIAVQQGTTYSYYAVNPDLRSVTRGTANAYDSYDRYTYLGEEKALRAVVQVNQELTNWLSAYGAFIYSDRKVVNTGPQYLNVTVRNTSPYFIPGIPGVTTSQVVNTRVPDLVVHSGVKNYSVTGGLRADLPAGWNADVYSTNGRSDDNGLNRIYLSTNAFATEVAAGRVNPFNITPDVIARLSGQDSEFTKNYFSDSVIKFNGPLFELPSGAVKVALGGEHTWTKLDHLNMNVNTPTATPQVGLAAVRSRSVDSIFAEIFVPVIGPEAHIPLIYRLDLSGAVRRDDYSDFGTTTNPKVGVSWAINDELLLRSTYGTSFRAPTLNEIDNLGGLTLFDALANNSGDPALVNRPQFGNRTLVALQLGGRQANQPSVGPEKAKTFSAGFEYKPHWLDGFRLSGTYYSIRYKDRIQLASGYLGQMLSSPENRAAFAKFITVAPQPATCVNGIPSTYAKAYQDTFAQAAYQNVIPFDNCLASGIIFAGSVNLGSVKNDGLDFDASYAWGGESGRWNIGLTWTEILKLRQQVAVTNPEQDVLGTIGYPTKRRVRANVGWANEIYHASLSGNYIGSYLNNRPATIAGVNGTNSQVPSWTTFDLNLGANSPDTLDAALRGLSIGVTINNLFGRKPPIVLSGTSAFDSGQANILGRTLQVQVRKRF